MYKFPVVLSKYKESSLSFKTSETKWWQFSSIFYIFSYYYVRGVKVAC